MRLDRFLSNNTELSRSEIHTEIRRGRVSLNGAAASGPGLPVGEGDTVLWNQRRVEPRKPRYFMLNKPAGYVSATTDGDHPTVLDLLDEPWLSELQVVGRLDIDTTGLLLLTDDGPWNHRITSPHHDYPKCYRVTTADPIAETAQALFAGGILLKNEPKATLPAELTLLDSRQALLTIREGKYHQVKRMFAAIGNRVTALHRERIGTLVLDPSLEPGRYRPLTPEELGGFGAR